MRRSITCTVVHVMFLSATFPAALLQMVAVSRQSFKLPLCCVPVLYTGYFRHGRGNETTAAVEFLLRTGGNSLGPILCRTSRQRGSAHLGESSSSRHTLDRFTSNRSTFPFRATGLKRCEIENDDCECPMV